MPCMQGELVSVIFFASDSNFLVIALTTKCFGVGKIWKCSLKKKFVVAWCKKIKIKMQQEAAEATSKCSTTI